MSKLVTYYTPKHNKKVEISTQLFEDVNDADSIIREILVATDKAIDAQLKGK